MTHVLPTKLILRGQRFTPYVVKMEWTADLYRSVTVSIAPGRRLTCIVGPRGATDEQARQAALHLVAYIS